MYGIMFNNNKAIYSLLLLLSLGTTNGLRCYQCVYGEETYHPGLDYNIQCKWGDKINKAFVVDCSSLQGHYNYPGQEFVCGKFTASIQNSVSKYYVRGCYPAALVTPEQFSNNCTLEKIDPVWTYLTSLLGSDLGSPPLNTRVEACYCKDNDKCNSATSHSFTAFLLPSALLSSYLIF